MKRWVLIVHRPEKQPAGERFGRHRQRIRSCTEGRDAPGGSGRRCWSNACRWGTKPLRTPCANLPMREGRHLLRYLTVPRPLQTASSMA